MGRPMRCFWVAFGIQFDFYEGKNRDLLTKLYNFVVRAIVLYEPRIFLSFYFIFTICEKKLVKKDTYLYRTDRLISHKSLRQSACILIKPIDYNE